MNAVAALYGSGVALARWVRWHRRGDRKKGDGGNDGEFREHGCVGW